MHRRVLELGANKGKVVSAAEAVQLVRDGDTVEIEIEGIGVLSNPVRDDVAD